MKLENLMGYRVWVLIGDLKENIFYLEMFGNEWKDFLVGSDVRYLESVWR